MKFTEWDCSTNQVWCNVISSVSFLRPLGDFSIIKGAAMSDQEDVGEATTQHWGGAESGTSPHCVDCCTKLHSKSSHFCRGLSTVKSGVSPQIVGTRRVQRHILIRSVASSTDQRWSVPPQTDTYRPVSVFLDPGASHHINMFGCPEGFQKHRAHSEQNMAAAAYWVIKRAAVEGLLWVWHRKQHNWFWHSLFPCLVRFAKRNLRFEAVVDL